MMGIENNIEEKNLENRAININSIQANSLYYVNNNVDNAFLDRGKAVINSSIFSEHMKKHGVTVKRGRSLNFIVMKFDYGTKTKTVDDTEIPEMSSGRFQPCRNMYAVGRKPV